MRVKANREHILHSRENIFYIAERTRSRTHSKQHREYILDRETTFNKYREHILQSQGEQKRTCVCERDSVCVHEREREEAREREREEARARARERERERERVRERNIFSDTFSINSLTYSLRVYILSLNPKLN